MSIIGTNHLTCISFDTVLDNHNIEYAKTELGYCGAALITRYDYFDRCAYERSARVDVDMTAAKVIVCTGRLENETLELVNHIIQDA